MPAITRLIATAFLLAATTGSQAFSITNVTVLPDTPLTPDTNVQLFTSIATPNQDAMLFMPTVVEQNGNAFTVDIFVTDGMTLPATDMLDETVGLGMLAPGEYSYLVRITTGYAVNFGVREVSGFFTVVPVPAGLWLFGSALTFLLLLKGRGLPISPLLQHNT